MPSVGLHSMLLLVCSPLDAICFFLTLRVWRCIYFVVELSGSFFILSDYSLVFISCVWAVATSVAKWFPWECLMIIECGFYIFSIFNHSNHCSHLDDIRKTADDRWQWGVGNLRYFKYVINCIWWMLSILLWCFNILHLLCVCVSADH